MMNKLLPPDHEQHTAPQEPHPAPKSLWQRWLAWNGSFFIISVLLHLILLIGATLLVVQVVHGRKEKLKFTAPPPSSAGPKEHQVKAAKKTESMSAPAISKRITSTAANAAIALPPMEMSSATEDVMSSVMSGLGANGLGAGVGAAGGISALPPGGLTAFGFKGATAGGLIGHFYDLRQTADRQPTDVAAQGTGSPAYYKIISEFLMKNWDDEVLNRYFRAKDSMLAVQFDMPCNRSSGAAEAFDVENQTKNPQWIIHYKGTVVAPKDGEFRFWVSADDFMAVKFDDSIVLASTGLKNYLPQEGKTYINSSARRVKASSRDIHTGLERGQGNAGSWFQVVKGKRYPIDVLIGDTGGLYEQILLIEESDPDQPYPTRESDPSITRLPLIQFRKGIPIPTYDPSVGNGDYSRNPEPAPFSIIFQAR